MQMRYAATICSSIVVIVRRTGWRRRFERIKVSEKAFMVAYALLALNETLASDTAPVPRAHVPFVDYRLSLVLLLSPVFDNKTKTTYTSQSQFFQLFSFIFFLSLTTLVLRPQVEQCLPTQRPHHAAAVRSHFYVLVPPLCAYIFLIYSSPLAPPRSLRLCHTKPRHTQQVALMYIRPSSAPMPLVELGIASNQVSSFQPEVPFSPSVSRRSSGWTVIHTISANLSLVSPFLSRPLDLFSLFSSLPPPSLLFWTTLPHP